MRKWFLLLFILLAGAEASLLPTPQRATLKEALRVTPQFHFLSAPASTKEEYRAALTMLGLSEGKKGMALELTRKPLAYCQSFAPSPLSGKNVLENPAQQAYQLKTFPGRQTISVVACAPEGFFYALQTLRQLLSKSSGEFLLQRAQVEDFPRFPVRGIFEGGYGIWSLEGRLSVLDWMGSVKLNTYLYGPKSDPKIRRAWRALYTDLELFAWERALERARENHIAFGYVISPELGMEYGSDADFATLLQKVRQIQSLGVRTFVLAFDDTLGMLYSPEDRKRFANLGEAESFLANRLYAALKAYDREAELVFVPEIYAGVHDIPYTESVAKHLQPDIHIGWTGSQIVAPSIQVSDLKSFEKFYGRPPALGDNWGTLFPLLSRSPELFQVTSQYAINPYNLQGEVPIAGIGGASEPELMPIEGASAAEFAWNPQNYAPEKTLAKLSQLYFTTNEAKEAFQLLMEVEFYQFQEVLQTDFHPFHEAELLERVAKGEREQVLQWLQKLKALFGRREKLEGALLEGCRDRKMGEALAKRVRAYGQFFQRAEKAVGDFEKALSKGKKVSPKELPLLLKKFMSTLRSK